MGGGGGGGSANVCLFVVEKERNMPQQMITGISGFGFFGPKMAVS